MKTKTPKKAAKAILLTWKEIYNVLDEIWVINDSDIVRQNLLTLKENLGFDYEDS